LLSEAIESLIGVGFENQQYFSLWVAPNKAVVANCYSCGFCSQLGLQRIKSSAVAVPTRNRHTLSVRLFFLNPQVLQIKQLKY
jgi:hypothetical protein